MSPALTVLTPHGSARLSESKPQIAVTACSMMNSRRAECRRAQDGEEHGERERQVRAVGERVGQIGAERDEAALGEVDDPGGPVDDHEAQRHERVARAERRAVEQQLEEFSHLRGTSRPAL